MRPLGAVGSRRPVQRASKRFSQSRLSAFAVIQPSPLPYRLGAEIFIYSSTELVYTTARRVVRLSVLPIDFCNLPYVPTETLTYQGGSRCRIPYNPSKQRRARAPSIRSYFRRRCSGFGASRICLWQWSQAARARSWALVFGPRSRSRPTSRSVGWLSALVFWLAMR